MSEQLEEVRQMEARFMSEQLEEVRQIKVGLRSNIWKS